MHMKPHTLFPIDEMIRKVRFCSYRVQFSNVIAAYPIRMLRSINEANLASTTTTTDMTLMQVARACYHASKHNKHVSTVVQVIAVDDSGKFAQRALVFPHVNLIWYDFDRTQSARYIDCTEHVVLHGPRCDNDKRHSQPHQRLFSYFVVSEASADATARLLETGSCDFTPPPVSYGGKKRKKFSTTERWWKCFVRILYVYAHKVFQATSNLPIQQLFASTYPSIKYTM